MKKKIIIWVAVIAVLALGAYFGRNLIGGQKVLMQDPADIVSDFYTQWLKAAQEPATANPNRSTLAKSPILSKALRTKIENAQKDLNATTTDPVLCQNTTPQNITIRDVYKNAQEAQLLVTSKDKRVTNEALVILKSLKGGWYIDDIQCSAGEVAPQKEFSFDNQGFLIKSSVPKPFDPKNWHLVFTENGEAGHVVPLFFSSSSQCTAQDGTQSVCNPSQFSETEKVSVQGQMTERGVDVVKLEVVK